MGIPKFAYVHSIIKGIVQKDIDSSLQAIQDVLNEGKDLENFIWEMIKHTKDILMYKVKKEENIYSEDEMKQIEEICDKVSKEELINIIYKLSEIENKMKISSQKIIVFETEIIKLCVKTDILSLEDRIANLEKTISSGKILDVNNIHPQSENIKEVKTPQLQKMNVTPQKSVETEATSNHSAIIDDNSKEKESKKVSTKIASLSQGDKITEWQTVINNLKNQGKVMLYANLINTDAIEVNDMTVSIKFYNGLNEFRKNLIEKHENMSALIKELSIICGKPMQIKLEDASSEKKSNISQSSVNTISSNTKIPETNQEKETEGVTDFLDTLDIEVNYIDEE